MKRILYLLFLLILTAPIIHGQEFFKPVPSPNIVSLKANLLSYAATTLSLGAEVKVAERFTVELAGIYNPWKFGDDKQMQHYLIQPEVRYWFCEAFDGLFVGVHGHYGAYKVGGIGFSDYMKDHYFDGWLGGAGATVGYQMILSNRLSLEFVLGLGMAHMDYTIYPLKDMEENIKEKKTNYFGPTKLGLNLVYIIK